MSERKPPDKNAKTETEIANRKKPVFHRKALLGFRSFPERPKSRYRYRRDIQQLREMERLIRHRHGTIVPETDDAIVYAEVAAIMLLIIDRDRIEESFPAWCHRWMPWAGKELVERLLYEDLQQHHEMPSDDALAHMLHLSYAERCELDIRCLGSHDVTKRQRAKLQASKRREQDRARKRRMRRQTGAKSRSEYEAKSLSRRSPWRDEGISRRTWYRRQQTR